MGWSLRDIFSRNKINSENTDIGNNKHNKRTMKNSHNTNNINFIERDYRELYLKQIDENQSLKSTINKLERRIDENTDFLPLKLFSEYLSIFNDYANYFIKDLIKENINFLKKELNVNETDKYWSITIYIEKKYYEKTLDIFSKNYEEIDEGEPKLFLV